MIDPNTKLTEHFTLKEMTASKSYPKIYNVPPLDKVDNLRHVCEWLEDLREAYNARYTSPDLPKGEEGLRASESGRHTPPLEGKGEVPIIINSGYRSPMLNRAVGGAQHSNHLDGCAADIRCPGKEANDRAKMALRYATLLLEIAEMRKERFDELIIERKGANWWVHFAVRPGSNRMWVTVLNKSN